MLPYAKYKRSLITLPPLSLFLFSFQTFIGILVIPPRFIPFQMIQQMFPHILVLWSDQTKPEKKGTKRKTGIFGNLRFPHMGTFLIDGLRGNCQSKRNIGTHFPCMERAVKAPPFHRSLIKHCMQVQCIVPVLWSSIFVTLMANKIGGLQFGIYRNCQISSRVFHTAVAALPLTKANRSDFE